MASCRSILKKLVGDGRITQDEYNKLLRNLDANSVQPVTIVEANGRKSMGYLDEKRQIVFLSYVTVDLAKRLGVKDIIKEGTEEDQED